MAIVDYFKRLFGISSSDPQSNTSQNHRFDVLDRQPLELDIRESHEPFSPFLDDNVFEQHIIQLENFLRNLPSFGFGFPDSPHNDRTHHPMSPFGPSHPDSGGFQIFGFPSIFQFGDNHRRILGPGEEEESMSPRDEVLKPSYRSSSYQVKDEDYDNLVKEKGPEVILDLLNKSEEADKIKERRMVQRSDMAPMVSQTFGTFTSTKFSYVNGKSVQEQITRLPDGTYEKRVTTKDAKGETSTVISHPTQDEIAPTMGGGFGQFRGFRGFGGFGPTLW